MAKQIVTVKHNGSETKPGKLIYLLSAQISLLILYPYFDVQGWTLAVFRCVAALTFLSAIYAVSNRRAHWIIGVVLGTPAAVLNAMAAIDPNPRRAVPTLICTILFLGFTLCSLLVAVVRTSTVTKDTIYAAVSVYLMAAGVWAMLYMLVHTLQPGAFTMTSRNVNAPVGWSDFLFYSFVTLTSTGYGDIVPATAQARSLSILEAVSGTMYIAVLIARLVGVYASSKSVSETRRIEVQVWSEQQSLAFGNSE